MTLPADARLTAFVAVSDLDVAARFYGGTLGLPETGDNGFAKFFDVHGTELRATKVQAVQPRPFTVLGWAVADVAATVDTLRAAGVETIRYPQMDQDERGVWIAPSGTRVAWFADPDGNVLSVHGAEAGDANGS